MLLSVVSAMPPPVAMPTTKVGMPIVAASVDRHDRAGRIVGGVSVAPGAQFGRPSVASRMKRGFWSVSPRMYAAPAFSAERVGVRLPLVTPPLADVRPAIAVWMAPALLAPIRTATCCRRRRSRPCPRRT